MIYKVTYGLKTADGNVSIDTTLGIEANSGIEALEKWAKFTTKFVRNNLRYLELLVIQHDGNGYRNGKFAPSQELVSSDYHEFIKSCHNMV
jgi:hypothetical protein